MTECGILLRVMFAKMTHFIDIVVAESGNPRFCTAQWSKNGTIRD